MVLTPRLTVLLPAMLGYDTVAAAIESWRAQTQRDHLEVLVLLPGAPGDGPASASVMEAPFAPLWIGSASLHEARAMGVDAARGSYVFFAEDHCLPDAEWAAVMLRRMDEGWDVINPGFRPGSRGSLWGLGAFLLAYAEWMQPIESGPIQVVCGANQCIRTELVRSLSRPLSDHLQFGAFLVRTLVRQQRRCYLEAQARMRHFDNAVATLSLREVLYVGLAFGAFRTETWAWPVRAAYALAWPVLAWLHGQRALVQYLRAGRADGIPATVFAAVTCQALAWGVGEAVGAWVGRPRVIPYLCIAEVKPVSRAAVARSDALEASRRLGR